MKTYMGVVYPEHCDAMGHMNVQHYVAAFDRGFWHLVAALGYQPSWRRERSQGWADVRHEIDFRREIRLGDLFEIDSEINAVGVTSLTARHRLSLRGGEVCAELLAKSVYFDLVKRQAMPLPEPIRCQALLVAGRVERSDVGKPQAASRT